MGGGWRRVAQFPYKHLKENDFENKPEHLPPYATLAENEAVRK
jgi:hypothetical protein